jgi:dodecin
MSNVYAITEIVGTSEKSVEDAIEQAVQVAGQTLRNLDWFEVANVRGHIKDGKVAHYQVALKLGFRYEAKAG